jgi:sortase A
VRRRVGWRGRVALVLAALGVAGVSQAAYLRAKAQLGQLLIESAWRRMQGGDEAARPWPWGDTWPVARLQVPAHGVDLFVLAGATGRTLAWGPGHLAGSALPGAPGNAVVAGHRDTHFAFLRRLEVGTEVRTEDARGRVRAYRVTHRFVTHERDAEVLLDDGSPRLTLVTCWPFDTLRTGGPLRYVVVAERRGDDERLDAWLRGMAGP